MSDTHNNIKISSEPRLVPAAAQSGYLHSGYANSLAEFGTPRKLSGCGGWILERNIPGHEDRDGMGPYPIFCCSDWSKIDSDIDGLRDNLVSLTMVTDPFGNYSDSLLKKSFDVVTPFKNHLVIDCQAREDTTRHHRYYARKALRDIETEVSTAPIEHLNAWTDLYANLIQRHNLVGIKAFSKESFAQQLKIPGVHLVLARNKHGLVGGHLMYLQGDVAYSHLLALTPEGYETRAAYAIYQVSIEYFRNRARWIDLGAGPGAESNGTDGLTVFKRGWTSQTRTAYLCGAILDREKYSQIAAKTGIPGSAYFPSYRHNELLSSPSTFTTL